MSVRAGIYVRISQDRTGQAAGVARQEADCRELCEQLGWAVEAVFTDNDVSASTGKRRKGFDALTAALEAGQIKAIVAWHPDRLTRRLVELEALVDLLNRTKAKVQTVQAGEWDLTTAAGRMTARVIGSAAQYESETKAERQKRKALEVAQAGRPNGGGPRPFGYEDDRVTIREDEAAHIRRAAKDVLAGRGLASIGATWPTGPRGGKRWDGRTVKRVLMSPRVAGLRQHIVDGRRLPDAETTTYEAAWPAILKRSQWEAVRAVLSDPARDRRPARPNSYLLGGLAVCGVCGTTCFGKPNQHKQRIYVCPAPTRGGNSCVARQAGPVEELVVRSVLYAAMESGREPTTTLVDDAAAQKALALEKRLGRLEDDAAAGKWDDDMDGYRSLRARLRAELGEAEGAIVVRPVVATLGPAVDRPGASRPRRKVRTSWETWWADADLTQRRAFLAEHVEAVRIMPTVRGRNTFDPDKIEIQWRETPGTP
jgi:DNA invertase Pin-like site-specific DNA recombinase